MEEDYSLPLSPLPSMEAEELQTYCRQGHRSSLRVQTTEGGSICLVCLSNLLSNPTSPPLHLSYALSQLSLAIEDPLFLQSLRSFHTHLLVPPLVHALSSFSDNSLACQIVDLIADLSRSSRAIASDFIVRITNLLSSGSLAWSRQQIYTLHCLGILLSHQTDGSPSTYIKDKGALISSLLEGLQLPSEKIHGEVLFVLYKLSTLQDAEEDYFSFSCPKLLSLSLQALMKTQNDDVRLNCIALLTMLARTQNFEFGSSLIEDPSGHCSGEEIVMPRRELMAGTSLVLLFADAIKGPLLSSDAQVQISALDLIFHSISSEASSAKQIQKLVEESIADYVFEVLRLSGNRDPLVVSCIRVLHLLATAEEAITQSLAIGFPTLLPALHHVAEMPLHPSQFQTLKLVWICISHCPGIISTSQAEETIMLLAEIFKRHGSGEMGLLPETFTMACSTFVTLLKLPCSLGIPSIAASIQEVLRSAVSSSLCVPRRYPNQVLLYSLFLLKEAYAYNQEHDTTIDMENMHSANYIIEICETHILPWLSRAIDEAEEEEEIILGVLETLHSVLQQRSDIHAKKFAEILASSYWFSLSFGCLGLFPSDQMKLRVYLMLSSIIDRILGNEFGQPIRDSASCLPQDPLDLLFLLEQRSSYNSDLISCQSAVILILYTSSLHNERLADDKQVLASLEQYILVNRTSFLHCMVDSSTLTQLVHLYGFIRGADKNYQTSYCVEAENLLFHVLAEKEWDLLSTRIHPLALKWLFKQEKIREPLSSQILNFCRFNLKSKSEIIGDESSNTQLIDTKAIAGLVADGDNCGPSVLVSLLKELHEAGQSDDIASVMNLMIGILNIFPAASNQFCLHGIIGVVHNLYCSTHSSATLSRRCSLLVFNILRFADPKMLSDKEAWVLVTTKLLDYLVPTLTADDTCNQDMHLVMGILSLILSQCGNQTLTEASKAILLNKPLASAVNNVIQAACVKGPALIDHDEEPGIGETLTSVLLLYFFSLRSLHALLEGTVEWQDFLESSNGTQPLSVICICCHDLCRLIHFGASPIKLVASQCLLELLTKISDQRTTKLDEFQCSMKYLKSMMAVLQGLIFYGQNKVAMNCSLCLSRIIGWEKLSVQDKKEIQEDRWFKLIMEELALSLTAPSLASKSFTNQHKPATHFAISLLEMDQEHKWIRSVLNSSCISGIISNLSASNVSGEMVELFRQLLACEYLNEEHIMGLNNVFQACRKRLYMEGSQENYREQHFEKVLAIPDDLGKICSLLIHLMSSPTEASTGVQTERKRLLEEIEMFSQEYSTRT